MTTKQKYLLFCVLCSYLIEYMYSYFFYFTIVGKDTYTLHLMTTYNTYLYSWSCHELDDRYVLYSYSWSG